MEQNDKLLEVFGIFGALTAFFVQLNRYLALMSFIAFFLLLLEVWRSFPSSENAATLLRLFEYAFFGMLITLGGYLFTAYETDLHRYVSLVAFIVFFGVYAGGASFLMEKTHFGTKVSHFGTEGTPSNVIVRYVVGAFVIGSVVLLTIVSAQLITRLIG